MKPKIFSHIFTTPIVTNFETDGKCVTNRFYLSAQRKIHLVMTMLIYLLDCDVSRACAKSWRIIELQWVLVSFIDDPMNR